MRNRLGLAISLTAEAFKTKTDKGGVPYILHCLYVMEHTQGDDCVKAAAVMHDLIEDTDESSPINFTLDSLFHEHGFTAKTVDILDNVTHREGETYEEYVTRAGKRPESINLKMADLEHNSLITRLKGVTQKDFERLIKYNKAYLYLKEVRESFI